MNIKPILGVVIGISLVTTPTLLTQLPEADATPRSQVKIKFPAGSEEAPVVITGDNVYVTWWERNDTSDEPVARVSNDNGATFGPLLRLAANGTIGGGG